MAGLWDAVKPALNEGAAQGAGGILKQGFATAGDAIFGNYRRDKELKQYKKTADYQAKLAEEAAQAAFNRQLEMYKGTKKDNLPETKLAEFKKAGLNAGLMYGQNGGVNMMGQLGGGTQANPTGGTMGHGMQDMGVLGQQFAMFESQKANVDANTRLMNVEADKKEGVDTQLAASQIAKNEAETEVSKMMKDKIFMETAGIELQNIYQEIQNGLAEELAPLTIESTKADIEYRKQQTAESIQNVKKMAQEVQNLISQKKLTDEQIKQQTYVMQKLMADIAVQNATEQILLIQQGTEESKRNLIDQQRLTEIQKTAYEMTQADLAKCDLEFYATDKAFEYIDTVGGTLSNLINATSNMVEATKPGITISTDNESDSTTRTEQVPDGKGGWKDSKRTTEERGRKRTQRRG